jgi:hypothetical protein
MAVAKPSATNTTIKHTHRMKESSPASVGLPSFFITRIPVVEITSCNLELRWLFSVTFMARVHRNSLPAQGWRTNKSTRHHTRQTEHAESDVQSVSTPKGNGSHRSPAKKAAVTVITFVVSVPVLSVQIVVALPMVSQAYK